MRDPTPRTQLAGAGLAIASLMVFSATALAQPLVIPPRAPEPEPEPAPAPAPTPPAPTIIPVQVDGQADGSTVDHAAELGQYHTDDLDGMDTLFGNTTPVEGTPFANPTSHHVVRSGDTLWDICWFYFNNPWEWPKIWSYNPHITNPHWIYPGDLVRLYPENFAPRPPPFASGGPADVDDPDEGVAPVAAPRYSLSLRQTAFIEQDDLEFAGTIVGAVDEKVLLSFGDEVYIEYPGDPPKIGERYAVYAESQKVDDPESKDKAVGAYVKILGEVRIASVKKGKRARALITDSVDVIERGARVGPVQRTYRTVDPERNKVDLQGTIVALLGSDQLIGQGQLVFIDLGEKDGVEAGNRFYVVRRGDAFEEVKRPTSDVGQDDRRFPARAIGEIIVVQTGENVSVGMVTLALQELGVGDLVLMRKSSSN